MGRKFFVAPRSYKLYAFFLKNKVKSRAIFVKSSVISESIFKRYADKLIQCFKKKKNNNIRFN